MADESLSATAIINASAEVIFVVLADPAKHAAIDGTGWVREPLGSKPLTAAGQVFRMAMYHPNHPDGTYQTANRVQIFDPPNAIAWEPGQDNDDGGLSFGGWVWRYDLTPVEPSDQGHPLLRLVCSPGRHPPAHRLPPVPCGTPGKLPSPSRRSRQPCDQSKRRPA